MLRDIQVKDFAIVEQLALEFAGGMTAMTGETGAGKSILVDALGLALGERADSSDVRAGAERTEVAVSFDISTMNPLRKWLHEHELDSADECLLRRVVSVEGRSRAFVNGTPVPVQLLKELGDQLVDIHGQHEHQNLLRRDHQREILDHWAENSELVTAVQRCFREWKTLGDQLQKLRISADARRDRLQLLEFQVRELAALGLQSDELERLDEEHGRLANAGRILQCCQNANQVLYERDSHAVHQQLATVAEELRTLSRVDPRLTELVQTLDETAIQIQEVSQELRHYAMDLDLDPQRLQEVEARLSSVHDLARKHRVEPGTLPQLFGDLSTELEDLQHADVQLSDRSVRLEQAERDYRVAAAELSAARVAAGERLAAAISQSMQGLAMDGGRFDIQVTHAGDAEPADTGLDSIEFLVSANPGQPVKALSKVASGGELSRVSLAIQVITWDASHVPTLIFDEVDSGIGGATAAVVGKLLRQLGGRCQVMCVTHLPQVASQAHHHYKVEKITHSDRTESAVLHLDAAARIKETARMLGGVEVTENTLTHAREMIAQAGSATT